MAWLFAALMLSLLMPSCVKRDFDEPPQYTPEIGFDPNASIAELKSWYVPGKFTDITDDLLIHALVVADDRSGNFYKTLVIQDSTGGIELKLNRTGIYTDFPTGMKIGIKCKGLTIGDYNGLIQLGQGTYKNGNFTNLSGIEDVFIDRYVFAGPRNQPIVPRKRTLLSLTGQDLSTLVQLDDLEFVRGDTGRSYADAVGRKNVNLNLTDCNGNEIILRSSGFADFAAATVPALNGSITAVLSKYQTDAQLYIRDLGDVDFTKPACNSGGGDLEEISVKDLRALFLGASVSIPAKKKIVVSVISDRSFENTTSRNIHVQDATAGVTLRFAANHAFNVNDLLEIDISGQELSEFNGLLQVNNVELAKAKKIGTQTMIPKAITIAGILADFENLESTLVEISDVTISKSSGSNFSGTCTINDGTASMDLFTQSYATFANENFPAGKLRLVGFLNQGGTGKSRQISIRSMADLVTGGGGGTPVWVSLKDLRTSFQGATMTVPDAVKIKAVVISDKDHSNITAKNIAVQDATAGIVVRFAANNTFALGDELEIDISNQELSEFNGLLQLNNVP
ncbi:MAG TPA: DUF5689 domain-containing protein, partial [Saprospiraceae bacterium]|nr:DUF5689 domain-containing protein [Saprospiraceae bacterium]